MITCHFASLRTGNCLLAGAFALAAATVCADDSLSLLREEVRAPSQEPEEDEPKKRRRRRHHHCDDEPSPLDELFGDFFATAAVAVVGAPFYIPHALHDEGLHVRADFPRFPYECEPGHMLVWPEAPCERFWWSTRVTAEYADFDAVDRLGGRVLWETASRWGLDASFHHWSEEIGPGLADDALWTGDGNLLFRFAQSEYVQMRTGVGLNWLADDRGSDFGFNFTYGGDVFPAPPFIMSADLDWGWLGDASLLHFRATAGVILGPAEVFTGYDYFDVGGAQFDGLIAGVRLWL